MHEFIIYIFTNILGEIFEGLAEWFIKIFPAFKDIIFDIVLIIGAIFVYTIIHFDIWQYSFFHVVCKVCSFSILVILLWRCCFLLIDGKFNRFYDDERPFYDGIWHIKEHFWARIFLLTYLNRDKTTSIILCSGVIYIIFGIILYFL